jgi:hypothetical protein
MPIMFRTRMLAAERSRRILRELGSVLTLGNGMISEMGLSDISRTTISMAQDRCAFIGCYYTRDGSFYHSIGCFRYHNRNMDCKEESSFINLSH